jgi:aspartyl-tRNA(Asn)/glutamyl-tRNA(Gln) amidotransferase subunit C
MSDQFDVRYVAQLARLDLSEAEIAKFQSQLGQVLAHVEQLGKVDVSAVQATAHANAVHNVFRLDEPRASLPTDAVLANAPRAANNLIVVPKVIE